MGQDHLKNSSQNLYILRGGETEMKIEKNSRQMPAIAAITREKDYCDLLYAWLQCNSERETIDSPQRIISKR
jgi:hypothetical protein